jgi:hypothetical protein
MTCVTRKEVEQSEPLKLFDSPLTGGFKST